MHDFIMKLFYVTVVVNREPNFKWYVHKISTLLQLCVAITYAFFCINCHTLAEIQKDYFKMVISEKKNFNVDEYQLRKNNLPGHPCLIFMDLITY